jgi:hypothetical protein
MNNYPITPQAQLVIIKRYLHVLALLQNNKDPVDWNSSTLADILSMDEADSVLTDKSVRDYIHKYLMDDLGIDVVTVKGGRRTEITGELDPDFIFKALSVYSSFVVFDSTKNVILESFIKKNANISLWVISKIYFASIEKRIISFNYMSHKSSESHRYMVHPYHMIFKNNNFYLVAGRDESPDSLFLMNKIENLKVEGDFFSEDVPPAEDVFTDKFGSFIGESSEVKIKFSAEIYNRLEQVLGVLEADVRKMPSGDCYEAVFSITDDLYLCRQLFMYGSNVEIISPLSLRNKMKELLENGLSVYK